jgi:hypothetical protein
MSSQEENGEYKYRFFFVGLIDLGLSVCLRRDKIGEELDMRPYFR